MVEKTAEESSLSSWAGPYVTQMLGRGAALANMPYQAYTGPLTAGQSDLQTKAFQGLSALTMPTTMGGFTPTSFTSGTTAKDYMSPYTANLTAPTAKMGGFTPTSFTSGTAATDYMNPYLKAALEPQYAAARRQSEIQQQELQTQYGRAGAYGGSRQGIAEGELQRGLLDRIAGITGTGYQDAYTQGREQFNTEQDRARQAQELTNRYGLDVVNAQQDAYTQGRDQFNTEQDRARQAQDMVNSYGFDIANALQDAGGAQRTIEQEGITADLAQFTEEQNYPQKRALFMQSLLDSLPLETQSYSYSEPSGLQNVSGVSGAIRSTLDILSPQDNKPATNSGITVAKLQQYQTAYDYYIGVGKTPEQARTLAVANVGTTG